MKPTPAGPNACPHDDRPAFHNIAGPSPLSIVFLNVIFLLELQGSGGFRVNNSGIWLFQRAQKILAHFHDKITSHT